MQNTRIGSSRDVGGLQRAAGWCDAAAGLPELAREWGTVKRKSRNVPRIAPVIGLAAGVFGCGEAGPNDIRIKKSGTATG